MAVRNALPETALTVGDLSLTATEKRRNRDRDAMRELRNAEKGLTVGDLYQKAKDERNLDKRY